MGDVFLQNRPTYNPLKLLHFLKHVCSTSNNVIFGPLGPAFCPRFLLNGVLEARPGRSFIRYCAQSVSFPLQGYCSISNGTNCQCSRSITTYCKSDVNEEFPYLTTFKNTLLRHLDGEIIERLSLRPVTFELRHEIEFPGRTIEHLFFVEEGMASMTATFDDGSQVEVGMFGYASVIGVPALMGAKRSLNRIYTQIEGCGYSCTIEAARKEFCRGGAFQALMLRFVQAQLVQAAQSTGCNAKHNMEQRLARW